MKSFAFLLLFSSIFFGGAHSAEVHEEDPVGVPIKPETESPKSTFRLCYFSLNHPKEYEVMNTLVPKFNQKLKDKKIEVIEYMPDKANTEESFVAMLESNMAAGTKCDGLVVSGHHTGAFDGDRGEGDLSIGLLEKLSCDPKYAEWFSGVKALWLQGCRTMGAKIQSNGASANDHADRVLGLREEDNLSQTYAELSQQFSDVMDEDNPLSSRYRRVFSRATVFGWTDSAPGKKSASEMSIPFHLAHMARLKDDSSPLYESLNSVLRNCPSSYGDMLTSLLGKDLQDEKFEKDTENVAIRAWHRHGRAEIVPGCKVNPSSFPNPDLKACQASCSESTEKQLIFAQARLLGCALRNYQTEEDVVRAAKILKSYPELLPLIVQSIGSFIEDPKELDPNIRARFMAELSSNASLIEYFESKLSDPKVGLLRKIDYFRWLKEISPDRAQAFVAKIQEEALGELNPKKESREPLPHHTPEQRRNIQELNAIIERLANLSNGEKISDILKAMDENELINESFIRKLMDSRVSENSADWILNEHLVFESKNLPLIRELLDKVSDENKQRYLRRMMEQIAEKYPDSRIFSRRVDDFFKTIGLDHLSQDYWETLKEQGRHLNTPRIYGRVESLLKDVKIPDAEKQRYLRALFAKSPVLSQSQKSRWAEKVFSAESLKQGQDKMSRYIEHPEGEIMKALDSAKTKQEFDNIQRVVVNLEAWQLGGVNLLVDSIEKNLDRLKDPDFELYDFAYRFCESSDLSFKNFMKICVSKDLKEEQVDNVFRRLLKLKDQSPEMQKFEEELFARLKKYVLSSDKVYNLEYLLFYAQASNHKIAEEIKNLLLNSKRSVVDENLLSGLWANGTKASVVEWIPKLRESISRQRTFEPSSSTIYQFARGWDRLRRNTQIPMETKEKFKKFKDEIYALLSSEDQQYYDFNSGEEMLADLKRSEERLKNPKIQIYQRRIGMETLVDGFLRPNTKTKFSGHEELVQFLSRFKEEELFDKGMGLIRYPNEFISNFTRALTDENSTAEIEKRQDLLLELLKILPPNSEIKAEIKRQVKSSFFKGEKKEAFLNFINGKAQSFFDNETSAKLFPKYVPN